MAILELAAGADASRCPNCAGPMSAPIFGRHKRKWFRHCRTCTTTTVSDEAPPAPPRSPPGPRAVYRPAPLPFERVSAIAADVAARLREPGEDG